MLFIFFVIFIFIFVYICFYIINKIIKTIIKAKTNTNIENFLDINPFLFINNKYFEKCLKKNNLKLKFKNNNYLIYNNNKIIRKYRINNLNPKGVAPITSNKYKVYKIYKYHNIPIPKFILINNKNINYISKKFPIGFPCVLKPINLFGGKDVFPLIKNKEDFIKKLSYLKKKYKEILYEEHIIGKYYRILIFENNIIDIVERVIPLITGNGIDSIYNLIYKKEDMFIKRMKPSDWNYLESKGFPKNYILEKNKKVIIKHPDNYYLIRIDLNTVPEINKKIFLKAANIIGAKISGIDFLSRDITVPYNLNNGKIIEINSRPSTKIHETLDLYDPFYPYNKIVKIIKK
jgi:hypothetical protein